MSEGAGTIPGSTADERAEALAGALAELAIAPLTLTTRDGPRTLTPRTTDLPGELRAHTPCTITAPGIRAEVTASAISWAADGPLAQRLRERLAAAPG